MTATIPALLAPIRERHGQASPLCKSTCPSEECQAMQDRAKLLAAVEAVEDLARVWTAKGEHDMAYSKTIPDGDIAMELLTHGADMVEKARHIRNALTAALGDGR